MNAKAEKLLAHIKADLLTKIDAKFRKGDAEHGGDIEELDCILEAMDELMDGIVYLYAELRKRKQRPQNKKKRMK